MLPGQLAGAERVAEMGGRRHFHLDHLATPRLITGTTVGLFVSRLHSRYPLRYVDPNGEEPLDPRLVEFYGLLFGRDVSFVDIRETDFQERGWAGGAEATISDN